MEPKRPSEDRPSRLIVVAAALMCSLLCLPVMFGSRIPAAPVVWEAAPAAQASDTNEERAALDRATMEATWSSARATWLLLAVGAVQLGFFVWQLRMMQKSIDVAADASRAALESANTVARAERAYVFGKAAWAGDSPRERDADNRLTIRLVFVNRGKTPAMIRMLRGYAFVTEKPPQELVEFPDADNRLPDGLVIAADGGWKEKLSVLVTDSEWRDLELRNRALYVVGPNRIPGHPRNGAPDRHVLAESRRRFQYGPHEPLELSHVSPLPGFAITS